MCGNAGVSAPDKADLPPAICGKDEIVPSGNRPNVLAIAPAVAKQLLSKGCDVVFVIWDVFPESRDQGGTTDCKVHRKTLDDNLKAARMDGKPIRACQFFCVSRAGYVSC